MIVCFYHMTRYANNKYAGIDKQIEPFTYIYYIDYLKLFSSQAGSSSTSLEILVSLRFEV